VGLHSISYRKQLTTEGTVQLFDARASRYSTNDPVIRYNRR